MPNYWNSDKELFALARDELFVALVGDVLDKLDYQKQFLSPSLKPIDDDLVIIGRAMPVLEADVFAQSYAGRSELSEKPFGMLFEALDDLKEGEVYCCAGSSHRYALWGGLMSTRALVCGANGAVVHGFHRDTREIRDLKFPLASFGSYAQDQAPRGKVVDWRVPIEMDGVRINPGDLIYGDLDGVLVIPKEIEVAAFEGAVEKARGEQEVLIALQNGMTTKDAFEKYGVM
ncbi:RraA family protein [Pseudovibrio sp. Tun.PSC04-5.I4]|uniref:RraA family protein n=1 Tax=Pseudovibrio sp. Tun.PSC04-5.I4 TaxID=1798213 RepID=UPI00087F11F2|nr:RraA family protein [Pseudovibrio sp. Tun.PSC04-5.I4]SDQ19517.1 Regulator of RNase E activity RraA [Pseudovibrio sp. Tun.PSC04-5.I4]